MKVSLIAMFLPPPHLARAGTQPQRLTKEVSDGAVALEIASVLQHAIGVGLFDAGGCINVVIQRAPMRPANDGRPI